MTRVSTKASPTASRLNRGVEYVHVDVFTSTAYAGNSLAVFLDPPAMSDDQMLTITQELRHFETIFVSSVAPGQATARVFDLMGELAFAGHPVLGAAAVLFATEAAPATEELHWRVTLPGRTVQLSGATDGVTAYVTMDIGAPKFLDEPTDLSSLAAAIGLDVDDLDPDLSPQVVSTGLRYLIMPVARADALSRAHVARPDFDEFLKGLGAEFVYVLDTVRLEGRHWNNDGIVEDVATGSAAGCVAAYLLRHGRTETAVAVRLSQGRFVGRPSELVVTAFGSPDSVHKVTVGGPVTVVGHGRLRALPIGVTA